MTAKIDSTTNWLYNHFKKPHENLNIQNCKTYGDIFYNDYYGIQPNTYVGCAILFDYFGIDTDKILVIEIQDKINILYGIYKDLIKFKGCDLDLLDKCLKFNKLDELINKKYKYHKSKYYQDFIDNKINIGNTYKSIFNNDGDIIDKNNNIIYKNFIILDDNYCPNCNTNGFITNKNSLSFIGCVPDCIKCCIIMCKNCAYIENENEPWVKTCFNCLDNKSTGNLKTNIIHKIYNHKIYDKNRFNIEGDIDYKFITELIQKQDKKCYICKETILLIDWKPYCCYQFSIDRIDNNKPHDKNNVLISCYYCNCRDYPKFDQYNKICKQKCHTDYKDLRHKNTISNIEINNLIN
jgi:hypothetical protein